MKINETNEGLTIFHLAVHNSDPQVAKLILDTFRFEDIRWAGWTILHTAVAYGPKETIQYLIESRHKLGINLEERTPQYDRNDTILHTACFYRDIEAVDEIVDLVRKALEEINSDIDYFNTQNEYEETPELIKSSREEAALEELDSTQ